MFKLAAAAVSVLLTACSAVPFPVEDHVPPETLTPLSTAYPTPPPATTTTVPQCDLAPHQCSGTTQLVPP